jgi:1-deoxy-D-xylulose-5-phosphate reductoisomerase
MKNVVILGSTGSIGCQTLDVIERMPDRFRVVGLAAGRNAAILADQAKRFGVSNVCIGSECEVAGELTCGNLLVFRGVEGMCELATLPEADVVVVAVAGAIGILPTHAAIEAGKTIALASKEVLVAAGQHTMRLCRERDVRMLPIDSEHSALFQCMDGAPENAVERLFLTASGGPFRCLPAERMAGITPEQALKHPTWNMGGLVTINSATLMNKGLEIIEARWLFDVQVGDIEVVVHPQSIIHSMVRFRDGSVLAQLGLPDMRLPIQYALAYPDRVDTKLPRLDAVTMGSLTFEAPDEERFPALRLARRATEAGGTMSAAMNAANEEAVALFLDRRISFPGIMETVATVMDRHDPLDPTFENVIAVDAQARREARDLCGA